MEKDTVLNMVRQQIAANEQSVEQYRSQMIAAMGAVQELKQLVSKLETIQELPQEAEQPKVEG